MLSVRDKKLISTRRRNPCATLQEIADKYDITRERVRQILTREELPTRAIIEKRVIYCLNCGKETIRAKFCSKECWMASCTIKAVCSQCGKIFQLSQSALIARTKRNKNGLLFCSNSCQGSWLGENYGFGAHPENRPYAPNPRKWDWDEVIGLRVEGLKYKEITKLLGISEASITQIARKSGLTKSPVERRTCDYKKVKEMREHGFSYREIGRFLGVSYHTVWRVINKGGH